MRGRIVAAVVAAVLLAAAFTGPDKSAPADGAPGWPDHAGSAPTGSGAELVDPVDLIGTWRLTDTGDPGDRIVRLGPDDLWVWRECGVAGGTWRADHGGRFVAYLSQATGGCADPGAFTPDWLARTVSFEVAGAERVLRDADGAVTARLLPGAEPTPGPDLAPSLVAPPEVTDEVREAFAPAEPLPPALVPPAAEELVGRWVPELQPASAEPAYVSLSADGSWEGSDGCNRQAGRWVAGPDGVLLAVAGPSTMIGCDNVPVGGWLAATWRAGLDGDRLVLLDREGGQLGTLVRG